MEAKTAGTDAHPIGGTLVIQPLPGIGDVIWHLPHLKSIAAQTKEKSIILLTKRRSQADALFEESDFVREVLWLDEKRHRGALGGWHLGNALRPYEFDTVWILHSSPRYGLAAWRGGIAERIGYGIGWQDAFLTTQHALPREAKGLSAIEKANRLLINHSVPKIESAPGLEIPARFAEAAHAEISALPRPWVSLILGASESFKQWGVENFGALAERLHRETGGTLILLGGKAEADMAARIRSRFSSPGWIRTVVDRPLMEAAAFAAASDVAVGNDTGLLNIAAATGTESVGLFGGSMPLAEDPRIDPILPPGEVRYGTDRMADIPVETVVSAVRSGLSGE
ncbi:glycosyltransferase family 9 protein [Nisaea acidiphila]|uniref:Glycosyltransferase family 9 protein n=1 Tax=Nisaea acidiphila TaxID=1862145 RepID=A0A9J7APU0_9PROT|nr:glycosyltransferase family 9 protein [Nisaea acidiphila]UUX49416.1 glycosyltransferase family 9 protein [Nisaea acidiphila]